MASFFNFFTTLNGCNSLNIQDNDIKVYIFEISIKFRIDWYITCIGLKKVKIWLNKWGGYFRILTRFIFANDDQFAKINPCTRCTRILLDSTSNRRQIDVKSTPNRRQIWRQIKTCMVSLYNNGTQYLITSFWFDNVV